MSKQYFLCGILGALALGFGAGCFYQSTQNKIAVVDVNKIVAASEQVKEMKANQDAKAKELAAWLQEADNTVKNEKDKAKQDELLQNYKEEFAAKSEEIRTQYAKELQSINDNITATITEEAKKKGYGLVIAKEFTIYGGKNITDEIVNIIK
ncbi:MAG: OmpH family outer membrane protein [Alphaproteobacteria bacterium]|nr:OmpH family outer membrane protein [Alphaproteobacteria bacterium]